MKVFLLYLVFAYLALTVQAIFFKGTKPDFVIILVCFYSLKYGQIKGVTFGALSGLLIDTASGFILGPNIISKAFCGFIIKTIRENIFQWNIFINSLVITVLSIADIFLIYLCLETFSNVSFANRPWGISVKEVIYTVLTAVILYAFFNPEQDSKADSMS
jgi:rod shape-determining protein MreD